MWLEIYDGKVIFKYESYDLRLPNEPILFDSSRSYYVKLGPNDAKFTESLKKPFLTFQ